MRPPRSRTAAVALSLLLVVASVGAAGVAGHSAASESGAHMPTDGTAGGPVTEEAVDGPGTGGTADGSAAVGPGSDSDDGGVAPITRCFTGDGYPISIGDGSGASMRTVIHLSVLTDPAAGNEFGVETAGRIDGESIVTLAAGVRLTARRAIADGIDPFAAFDVLYTYELRLPMFDGAVGDADYEDDGSPIDSSAGAVDC